LAGHAWFKMELHVALIANADTIFDFEHEQNQQSLDKLSNSFA